MKRRATIAATMGVAMAMLVGAPAVAQDAPSRTMVVDTTADRADASPGDGTCADADGRCSLRAAVQEANASDGTTAIRLARRTRYPLTLTGAGEDGAATGDLDVSSSITIEGRGSTVALRRLGDRGFDVQDGAELTATALRVRGGTPPTGESGGAFRSSGTLALQNATVDGNTVEGAGASGGAVANVGGQLYVLRSTLKGNSATRAGGAIEATEGSATEIVQATLTDNETGPMPGNGGALHLTGAGQVRIFFTTVSGNVATAEGGGVWNSAVGDMTLGYDLVTDNAANGTDADNGGGGVFNDGGILRAFRTGIADNTATQGSGSGGGILNDGGIVDSDYNAIIRNAAARAGGGIETVGGNVDIDHDALWVNSAGPTPGNGGGLHVSGPGVVRVSQASVILNTAGNEGGGLWNSAVGTMTVDRTLVVRNTAEGDQADEGGGGIFNQSSEDGTSGGSLTVTASRITANRAVVGSGSGGGILNERGTVAISDTLIPTTSRLAPAAASRSSAAPAASAGSASPP